MSAATGNIDSSSASASLFPSPERARRSRDELSDGDEPTLLSQTKRRRTTEVSRLTDRVASLEDEVQDLKDYRKKTSERHKGIVKAIQQLEERADAGQATQAKQQEELVSVQNLAASITSAAPLTQAEQATADNIRDNALNDAIKEVLFTMLGTDKKDPLPAALPEKDSFYMLNPLVEGEKLLRPKWEVSWSDNRQWHKELFRRLKNEGPALCPAAAPSIVALTEKALKSKMSDSIFKSLKERWKREQQTREQRLKSKRTARRAGRKSENFKARELQRRKHPELKGKRFDIVLEVSDDETSEEEDDSTATRSAVAQPLDLDHDLGALPGVAADAPAMPQPQSEAAAPPSPRNSALWPIDPTLLGGGTTSASETSIPPSAAPTAPEVAALTAGERRVSPAASEEHAAAADGRPSETDAGSETRCVKRYVARPPSWRSTELAAHIARLRDEVEKDRAKKDAVKRRGAKKFTPRVVGAILEVTELPRYPDGVPHWAVDPAWLEQYSNQKQFVAYE